MTKVSGILANIKKLKPARQKYWIARLKALKPNPAKAKAKELGAEPESDTLLEFANWLDSVYETARKTGSRAVNYADEATLALANRLDTIDSLIKKEASNVGGALVNTATKSGEGFKKGLGLSDYWPFLIGAAGTLIAVYYLSNVSSFMRKSS